MLKQAANLFLSLRLANHFVMHKFMVICTLTEIKLC